MSRQVHPPRRGHFAAAAVLVVLTAALLLGTCLTASALRPRTTPTNAARLAATREPAPDAGAAARHDAAISRMLARHAAAGGAPAPPTVAHGRRLHRPTALTAHGALVVATLAAVAAISLVAAAIAVGSRRAEARRRASKVGAPAASKAKRPVVG
jgi:hypothetical protein